MNNLTKMKSRELALEEIPPVIGQFASAARRARESGFDGLELHAAHSYMLLGSFLSALRNRRTDSYGGDLQGRLKFPLEAIHAIRASAGPDFPLTMRISAEEQVPGGRDLRETCYIARIFEEAGIAGYHVSSGVYPDLSWRVIPPTGTAYCLNASSAAVIKRAVKVPVMVVGRIVDPGMADDIIGSDEADMVVLGRALLADPEWPAKAQACAWEDIAPCIGCGLGCVRARENGMDMTCVINPSVGREREMTILRAERRKKIMVAGAGPAGLEAARDAALSGHEVVLYEKELKPGGQFILAAVPPGKQELCKLIGYLCRQAEKAGVKMNFGVEVTPLLIESIRPEVLVVATGGRPRKTGIPGAELGNVFTAHEVLSGAAGPWTGKVLIIGGGMVGCELASYLANTGDNITLGKTEITIVEMQDSFAADMFSESRELLFMDLRHKEVQMITSATVKEILTDGAVIDRAGSREILSGMNAIILALGSEPVETLSGAVSGCEVRVIGDAAGPRKVMDAIREGAETGRAL